MLTLGFFSGVSPISSVDTSNIEASISTCDIRGEKKNIRQSLKNLNKINVIAIPHLLHMLIFSVHYLEQNACV